MQNLPLLRNNNNSKIKEVTDEDKVYLPMTPFRKKEETNFQNDDYL